MAAVEILGLGLFILALATGLVAVVFGLPGTWIILLASAGYGWFTGFTQITGRLLLGLFLIAACAEGVEALAGLWGARHFGGSRKAMVGSLVGGIAGALLFAPLLFGLGSVPGAFLGAFLGASLVTYLERRHMEAAVRVGWGSFLGRVVAVVFKGAAAVAMIGISLWALFP
jgi:uncharacterized protein YqgC (DUF456 family)